MAAPRGTSDKEVSFCLQHSTADDSGDRGAAVTGGATQAGSPWGNRAPQRPSDLRHERMPDPTRPIATSAPTHSTIPRDGLPGSSAPSPETGVCRQSKTDMQFAPPLQVLDAACALVEAITSAHRVPGGSPGWEVRCGRRPRAGARAAVPFLVGCPMQRTGRGRGNEAPVRRLGLTPRTGRAPPYPAISAPRRRRPPRRRGPARPRRRPRRPLTARARPRAHARPAEPDHAGGGAARGGRYAALPPRPVAAGGRGARDERTRRRAAGALRARLLVPAEQVCVLTCAWRGVRACFGARAPA